MLLKLAEKHTQNQDRLNRDGTLFFSFFLFLLFFYPGGCVMFTCVLGRLFASTVLSVPEPFGGR